MSEEQQYVMDELDELEQYGPEQTYLPEEMREGGAWMSVNAKDIENSWDRDWAVEKEAESYARENELNDDEVDHYPNS